MDAELIDHRAEAFIVPCGARSRAASCDGKPPQVNHVPRICQAGEMKAMPTPLEQGSKAVAFSLEADGGGKIALKDFAGKPVVLYFYPKDDTSGCTKEALDFTANSAAFKKLGVNVIGISKDSVAAHDKFKKKHKLN